MGRARMVYTQPRFPSTLPFYYLLFVRMSSSSSSGASSSSFFMGLFLIIIRESRIGDAAAAGRARVHCLLYI